MTEQLAAMPKYEAYKESGEAWISEIPEHWEIRKLKQIFYEKKHKKNTDLNCGSISYGKVVIKDEEKIPYSTKQSYQEVLKGEFLINPLNLNYDLISLRISLSSIDVVVSPGYIVLNTHKDINKEYFKYLLHRYDVAYMKLLGSGVRQTINFNHIANSILLFPPLSEQTAIAAFLDRKIAQIDQAVAIKEQQIALLKERKQILIQNAVTRGLNPDAPMRDSSVEWIGETPRHWEVITLKRIVDFIQTGPFGAELHAHDYVENGVPLINPKHMKEGNIIPDATCSVDINTLLRLKKYQLADGDLIMARRGELGRCAIVSKKEHGWLCGTGSIVVRLKQDYFNIKYFFRIISGQGIAEVLGLDSVGSTMDNLNTTIVGKLVLAMPSMEEQTAIVTYIDTQSAKIDQAISIQQQQIDKLKEYKATLINSAVTGKIKVSELSGRMEATSFYRSHAPRGNAV